jgi:hypothetical protein
VRRKHVLATILLALPAMFAMGGSAPAQSTPAQTVRAYIAAVNAKDGRKICSLLHPAEARAHGAYMAWTVTGVPVPVPCYSTAQMIGSGGGRDNSQSWRHATILRVGPSRSAAGGVVSIDVRMRDSWEDEPPSREARTTRFWLARDHGRWVVVRRSSLLDMAMFSAAGPLDDEPPATREPGTVAVRIAPARFRCAHRVAAADDPAGDEHALPHAPSLDIRRVELETGPAVCVVVRLGAPLRPGTAIDLSFATADHERSLSGERFVVEADGTVWFTGSRDARPGDDYGMVGPSTIAMRFTDVLPDIVPTTTTVTVEPLSLSEPLIHTQPLLGSGDGATA